MTSIKEIYELLNYLSIEFMLIIVLGGGINLQGQIPLHVYQRLDKAIKLYKKYPASKIILTGKYSYLYDSPKSFTPRSPAKRDEVGPNRPTPKFPPTTEAAKMSEYLLQQGLPKSDLLLEEKSKNTFANAYYLKKNFFLTQKSFAAIIITSHFHIARVKYIFQKVFGPSYRFEFIGMQERLPKEQEEKVVARQDMLLLKTKQFLSTMKEGDHEFLKGKFYKADYYKDKIPDWVKSFVAKGR